MKPEASARLHRFPQRLTDQVEELLRHSILAREILPGAKLPPERRLSEELGVNRSSVREAIRRLESQNLVESRQGAGTRVLDFLEKGGVELISSLLLAGGKLDRPLLEDVFEFRSFVGEGVAQLAAERRREEDLADLEQVLRRMEQMPAEPRVRLGLDLELFSLLGRAAGNLVMRLLVNAISEPCLAHADLLGGLTAEAAALLDQARALVRAVSAQEPATARAAARAYLEIGRRAMEEELDLPRRSTSSP
jgi:DNA-binding FadR family transcriptional regulator